jgi:uncharacterized membrane protein
MNDTPPVIDPGASASSRPERVRVTAPLSGEPLRSVPRVSVAGDAESVIVDGLIRSQLRLALICAIGFAAALVAIALVASVPALDDLLVAGVPISWLVLAFGAYPPLVVIAAIAVLAARRNEAQYRVLSRRSELEGPVE